MAGGRARRIPPAVLLSLGLLLGLCAAPVSTPAYGDDHRPVTAPAAATAMPAADVHSARRLAAPGPQPRLSRHRQAGDMSPLTAAVPMAVSFARAIAGRRPGPRRADGAPDARGLFARDSRAPPRHLRSPA